MIAALGPLGSAESIDVGLTSVHLTNVLLKAPPGWPAGDPLRADEITLTPDIRDLIARRMHIRSVVVRGFDMAVLRAKDGTIGLLPNLRQSINNADNSASERRSNRARAKSWSITSASNKAISISTT